MSNMSKVETLELSDVTLLRPSGFVGNYIAVFCKKVRVWRAPYAQYPTALHVEYLQPRQRRWRTFVDYSHRIVLVEGDRRDLAQPMGQWRKTDDGTLVQTSEYPSFDPRWAEDFAATLDHSDAAVLFDSAHHTIEQARKVLTF